MAKGPVAETGNKYVQNTGTQKRVNIGKKEGGLL